MFPLLNLLGNSKELAFKTHLIEKLKEHGTRNV